MKAVIFAGGVGTRLWPLSRKKSPKQFEKIIGEKSTLQLAVERLLPEFKPEDIYISTGQVYKSMVAKQLAFIPKENIIGEPEKKDVGPAVSLVMAILSKKHPNEPVAILWSDHLVKNETKFKKILSASSEVIKKDPNKIIFIGQKPRFASDNLGWIETKAALFNEQQIPFYEFKGSKYKPNKLLAEKYFANPKYCWNLGYFVSTPAFICSLFERFDPSIFSCTEKIMKSYDTPQFEKELIRLYKDMPEINFDNAVLEQLDPKVAYVVMEDIGWSDVGAWEALKEALEQNTDDNITKGNVLLKDSIDNLVYNFNNNLTIVGVDMNEFLVVNTHDVLLIAKKTSVSKIKKVVEGFKGTDHEKLT
ncbi:MAG: sugar phosphate nucleotidyltransferase [bacterium]|nr:sugar phosphate nucleotidyltransferase [bacterium]